jgi:tetratricopeptide (TPR) repeat protein
MLVPVVHDYVRDQPNYPDTHNTLGSIYLKLNKLSRAAECCREALRINPDYLKARVNLFDTLHLMGQADEAARQGEYIIAKNLDYPDVYCTMGDVLLSLGRHDEALVHLEKAIQLRPHYGRAHYLKARFFAFRGRHAEAALAYEACLASYPPADIGNRAREELTTLRQGS